MSSSDPPSAVTVIEGMPGAGKTTVLAALARAGRTVLGEYTTETGAVLAPYRHPGHGNEDAHLANWLRKSAQLRRLAGPVWVDRDWLTALAWSASTNGLTQRAAWAHHHLAGAQLVLPHRWIILDLPPTVSLQRRARRLEAGHPWSRAAALERLRVFYRDPPTVLKTAHPGLARLVAGVPLLLVDATAGPGELARAVERAGMP
jgi:thymidylate kinase